MLDRDPTFGMFGFRGFSKLKSLAAANIGKLIISYISGVGTDALKREKILRDALITDPAVDGIPCWWELSSHTIKNPIFRFRILLK